MSRKSDECLNEIENSRIQLEDYISEVENDLEEAQNTIKDKSNEASAEATGHAFVKVTEKTIEKQFEKLETIAVGRALALLGYSADGEIASSEEMEEFLADKESKRQDAIDEATERIGKDRKSVV